MIRTRTRRLIELRLRGGASVLPKAWRRLVAVFAMLAIVVLAAGCQLAANAELETYYRVNALRTDAGLRPLIADQQLADVARFHSQDMAARHTLRHEFANGCTIICVMDELGLPYAWAGENTESNNWEWTETAEHAVSTWQSGSEHLANMMNCHYTRFGAGVTPGDDGRIYFSLVFEGDAAC